MYYNQSIPPNPIGGNMVGIGSDGYMSNGHIGGYYNNNYNYYNPYLAMERQRIEEENRKKEMLSYTGILKSISKSVNSALGSEVTDEELDKHWTPYDMRTLSEDEIEDVKTYKLMNLYGNENSYKNLPNERFIEMSNQLHDSSKQEFPDDMDLFEFLSNGNKIYNRIIDRKIAKSQRNLSKMYDNKKYNQLIGLHSNNVSYFNSFFGIDKDKNVSLDDLETQIPESQKKYLQQRQAFMDQILKD